MQYASGGEEGARWCSGRRRRHYWRGWSAVAVAVLLLVGCSRGAEARVDADIVARIAAIKAIDNHAHPSAGEGDRDYDALPVEMLEPGTDPVRLPAGPAGDAMTPGALLDWAGPAPMVAYLLCLNGGLP